MISLERRDGRPLRIGHRGAAALAPENTLESFRAAVEAGVDLVEFDVIELRGGGLVVAHSRDQIVPETPTLDDALAFFADEASHTGLHLDLKTRGTEAGVAAALGRFDLLSRSFVSSFHFSTVRKLARIAPRIRIGITLPRAVLGITESGRGALFARGGLWLLRRVAPVAAPLALPASRATALVLHHSLVGEAVVRRAHDRGAAVVTWTVDDQRDLARVDAVGVDAVVTNDPRIFTSTLET